MNKKYTIENIKQICEENGYELISDKYIGYHKEIILKDLYGYYYKTSLSKIVTKRNIQKFGIHNPYTIQNIRLWCKLNDRPFELLSDVYTTPHEDLVWKCLKDGCNEIFKMNWANVSQNGGCSFCHGKKVGLSNCLATKFPNIASEWHPTKNGDLTPYDITYGSRIDIWWKCHDCGLEWMVSCNSRTSFQTGCPECNKSKGELRINKFLYSYGILFIPQKEFNNLLGVGNGNLSYDFYLPEYNLLIEYQGKQHKHYCEGFQQSRYDFEKQQEHDKRKREYAKNNNINLLEIWYWDFDRIEEILINELNIKQK